jgi:hypothetical protein
MCLRASPAQHPVRPASRPGLHRSFSLSGLPTRSRCDSGGRERARACSAFVPVIDRFLRCGFGLSLSLPLFRSDNRVAWMDRRPCPSRTAGACLKPVVVVW